MKEKIKNAAEWAFYIGTMLGCSFLIGLLLAHLHVLS